MTVPAETPPPAGHETRDIRVGAVVKFGIGIAGLLLFTMATMAPLLDFYRDRVAEESPKASPLAGRYGPSEPPEPRLQIVPAADMARLRADEQAVLGSYAWVDRTAGTVRIPIARAMQLLAQRRAGGQPR